MAVSILDLSKEQEEFFEYLSLFNKLVKEGIINPKELYPNNDESKYLSIGEKTRLLVAVEDNLITGISSYDILSEIESDNLNKNLNEHFGPFYYKRKIVEKLPFSGITNLGQYQGKGYISESRSMHSFKKGVGSLLHNTLQSRQDIEGILLWTESDVTGFHEKNGFKKTNIYSPTRNLELMTWINPQN